MRSARTPKGFTLIELLTVIVIVATLSVLGVYGVQSARQKGRESACLSNLRQLGVAAILYSGENNGRMVPHAIFDETINQNREWCYGYGTGSPEQAFKEGILGPYLSNAQEVLLDPTFSYKGDPMETTDTYPARTRPTTFGFGYNGFYLSRKMTTYGQWEGHHLSTVERPEQTVMFATSAEYAGGMVRPYENIWPRQRLSQKTLRAVDGKNAYVCWVSGGVSKVPVTRGTDYDGTLIGHVEGPDAENVFDRFDGDRGDRN